MTNIQKKIASAIAAGSILLQLATPVLASTTIEITGNGNETRNTANVNLDQSTAVTQSNSANVTNHVNADATTGKNDANRNTGGDVSVMTGDSYIDVAATNSLNSNSADVSCCSNKDIDVLVAGNGDSSVNTTNLNVNQDQGSGTYLTQSNKANVKNDVNADATTGKNDANRNTGGNVTVDTGSATTLVTLATNANANSAKVGGGFGDVATPMLSARIVGNGVDTHNTVNLGYDHQLQVLQSNNARVLNDVDAVSATGHNDANKNTSGEVSVTTGDAGVGVSVDNSTNFNWADVDCGCLFDVLAKVANNGDSSVNTLKANLGDTLYVDQDNCGSEYGPNFLYKLRYPFHHHGCSTDNYVDATAATGKNDANSNTGGVNGYADPSVDTGNSTTLVDLTNSGNSNMFGQGLSMPDMPDMQLDFGFNWVGFLAWFSGMYS